MSRQNLKFNVMKKIIFTVSSIMFMSFFSVKGNNFEPSSLNYEVNLERYNTHEQTLSFYERGITFFVFPNGEFDFNTHPRLRSNSRRTLNTSFGAPSTNTSRYYADYGVRIEHDNFGRVRRIGHVFINYDRYGRIKRAGSVYMRYNRQFLSRIGGMSVRYNRYGRIINTIGSIKPNSYRPNSWHSAYDYGSGSSYYQDQNHNDWNNHNDDEYYYRHQNKTTGKKKLNK